MNTQEIIVLVMSLTTTNVVIVELLEEGGHTIQETVVQRYVRNAARHKNVSSSD